MSFLRYPTIQIMKLEDFLTEYAYCCCVRCLLRYGESFIAGFVEDDITL